MKLALGIAVRNAKKEKKMETKIVMWPNGTWTHYDDFDYERDWAWMSDDYEIKTLTEEEYEKLL